MFHYNLITPGENDLRIIQMKVSYLHMTSQRSEWFWMSTWEWIMIPGLRSADLMCTLNLDSDILLLYSLPISWLLILLNCCMWFNFLRLERVLLLCWYMQRWIYLLNWSLINDIKSSSNLQLILTKNHQVTFIYTMLFTVQIISKHLHSIEQRSKRISDASLIKYKSNFYCKAALKIQ